MRSHTASVNVGKDRITVRPDPLVMTTDDDVQWASANGRKFAIEFEGKGPFGSQRLAHAAATAKQKPRVLGRFKYSVVSEENPGLKLDPDIIVDPPPSKP